MKKEIKTNDIGTYKIRTTITYNGRDIVDHDIVIIDQHGDEIATVCSEHGARHYATVPMMITAMDYMLLCLRQVNNLRPPNDRTIIEPHGNNVTVDELYKFIHAITLLWSGNPQTHKQANELLYSLPDCLFPG